MLTIGPFRIVDVEAIQKILESKNVPFEVFADEDVREEQMARFNEQASKTKSAGGSLNLAYLFFEIDPAHFPKAQAELEKLGITPPSDGSFELADGED